MADTVVNYVLEWDKSGDRYYETGTDHGVLYQIVSNEYTNGVAWNGLTAVTESPDGAEPTDLWADNIKYATLRSAETFGGTIEAYTYPDEFCQNDGSEPAGTGVYIGQQKRKPFGFCYRTRVGSDTMSTDEAFKLHLVYGATASPSEKAYETINDSPDAITFSWEFTTTPLNVTGMKPTSLITIDSTKADPDKLAALMQILYGTPAVEADLTNNIEAVAAVPPKMPLPDAVIAMFSENENTNAG